MKRSIGTTTGTCLLMALFGVAQNAHAEGGSVGGWGGQVVVPDATLADLAGAANGNQSELVNSPPLVSNITAGQRADGSKLVDIYYNLGDGDGDACAVTVPGTSDGWATWAVPITAVSGAVGAGITLGVNRHIMWNCAADLPGAYGTNYKVRVSAKDGQGPRGEMVLVPGGLFQMGDPWNEGFPNERPVHTVYISPFYIDTYEVTNQHYADALNWAWSQGGLITVTNHVVYQAGSGTNYPYCSTTSAPLDYPNNGQYSRITWDGSTFGVVAGRENHPVLVVSWYGTAAYCNWRSVMEGREPCFNLSDWTCDFTKNGYRLPTEAEWEKAAAWDPEQQRHFRFAEQTDGCGYSCLDGQRANFVSSGDPFETGPYSWTTPVGYYDGSNHGGYQTQDAKSYYGCRDMSGNSWEWCYDWYSNTYYSSSPSSDPTGPVSGTYRVLRGGAWCLDPSISRTAYRRDTIVPSHRGTCSSFRCVVATPDCFNADPPVAEPTVMDNGFGTRVRYLAFSAGYEGAGRNQAIRVTFADLPAPFEYAAGRTMWVGQPVDVSETAGSLVLPPTFKLSGLQCDPFYTDWTQHGVVHVRSESLVPRGFYDVQAIDQDGCSPAIEGNYSDPLPVKLSKWGNTVGSGNAQPPNGPGGDGFGTGRLRRHCVDR